MTPSTTAAPARRAARTRPAAACLLAVALAAAGGPARAETPDALPATERAALAARAAGDFERALAAWAEVERALGPRGSDADRSRVLAHKSAEYAALGRLPDAVASAQRARALAAASGDDALLAAALAVLGHARLAAGETDAAGDALREAAGLAARSGLPAVQASAANGLAVLAASRGRFGDAAAGFADAMRLAGDAGDAGLAASAAVNRARALADAGDTAGAAGALAEAERRLLATPDGHGKAFALVGLARLHLRAAQRDPAAAQRLLQQAGGIARASGDARVLAYAEGYRGALLEEQGRGAQALAATRDALLAAQRAGAPESLYRWQWQSARLLRAGGDTAAALAAYRRAVATLEQVRPDLDAGPRAAPAPFRERVGPLYLQLADLLLREAAPERDARRREALLREARATVELLKGAELADYFQDDCVAQFHARSAGIDRLAAHTAAVYPILLAERMDLLLSLPDGIRLVSVPVGEEAVAREVAALRALLVKRTTHDYLPHARRLYDWLIRPLEAELAAHAVDTLVVVPDGALRTVPLATLHDGERFLVERFAVATSPGLTLTDPRPLRRDDPRMLVVALSDPVQGFSALPDVDTELGALASLYRGTVLRNDEFVVPSVERELTGKIYSVVHVASHARFDRDLANTFLLTYESRLTMDALGTLIGATALRDDPVELLTLSACQTAAGDDRAALGLAGLAVKSGARSALATLWFINDRASSMLVSKFYRHLASPATTKAEALRRAQRELLADRFYRHPVYWGPFLMIGNWL